MHTLDELIAHAPVFAGLPADDLTLIAGCAKNVGFEEGELLFREGEAADTFYLVRRGLRFRGLRRAGVCRAGRA